MGGQRGEIARLGGESGGGVIVREDVHEEGGVGRGRVSNRE